VDAGVRVAVLGGTGMIGSAIVNEAVEREHNVTSVSRSPRTDAPDGVVSLQADASERNVVEDILWSHDAVVAATVPDRAPDGDHQPYSRMIENLSQHTGSAYVLFVGGFGSLLMPDGTPQRLRPGGSVEKYRREAQTVADGLEFLRSRDHPVTWTYLCPPYMIRPGHRSGAYKLGSDQPVGDEISTQDFAVAVLDELERPAHKRARFTVAN
jgi:putative NADH-flavin reductase